MDEQQNESNTNQPEEPVLPEVVATETAPVVPSNPPITSEPAPTLTPTPAPAMTTPTSSSPKSLDHDNKLFAAISYLSILFIIPWVVKKDDPYVAFHLKQGIGLFVGEVIVWVALWLIESFLTVVLSYHAVSFVILLNKVAWLFFAALSLVGVYYAFKGQTKKLPWIDVITQHIKF